MIQIQHLTKKYGKFLAVNDVSFTVREGEIFALIGPNGSGKTTTLKSIVGLVYPTSGRIVVDGVDIAKAPAEARSRISYVPQNMKYYNSLTAVEILRFFADLRGVSQNRVQEVLAHTSFNGFSNHPISEYSGGMRQKLNLAIAYLADSSLMILDEPTASLDPRAVLEFRQILKDFKSAGKTILFSSHDMSEVEHLADRIGIMVRGRVIALEKSQKLRTMQRGKGLVVHLDQNAERFVPTLEKASGRRELAIEASGKSLVISCESDQRLDILNALDSAGAGIVDFAPETRNFEEVYLEFIEENEA
ncbi:ABC transporter ATP-binding protein [candidate division KSB1 bacterium]|nr:ABC transporter ATP-binding protein [candidate division KSB1 bacterium]NIR73473.1 ABC transporter ATP-binding protein [candidate division KSB1 bacterium]NIS25277.1 ABC transporter ATP-binding protein [candidate division KSB1 bacterium]NIT72181.1 ABC transporter ATP-binding protein [candidate division KSB1 bacterium]NIU25999.1 ABC transporter ATP-binding protein [candidate division KSB1 bacterium]